MNTYVPSRRDHLQQVAQFEARRAEYHRALQEAFFTEFRIKGTADHVIKRGESVWVLAQQRCLTQAHEGQAAVNARMTALMGAVESRYPLAQRYYSCTPYLLGEGQAMLYSYAPLTPVPTGAGSSWPTACLTRLPKLANRLRLAGFAA